MISLILYFNHILAIKVQGTLVASLEQESDSKELIKKRAQAKLVNLLYDQTPISIYVSLVIGVMVVYILWDVFSHKTLTIWISMIFTLAIFRRVLVRQFRTKKPGIDEIHTWDKLYLATLFFSSFIWGITGWIFMSTDLPLYEAFISFVLFGMTGGAVGSYNARFSAILIMETMLLLPMTTWLLVQDDIVYKGMAFGVIVFIMATLKAAKRFETRILESFRLGIELEEAHKNVKVMANTDDLTKLNNRRSFFTIAEQAFNTAKRYNQPLSLVMIDVDKFKRINDTKGHMAGDKALAKLAQNIKSHIRAVDIAGRFGGDEFSILLPSTSMEDIMVQVERLREIIAEQVVTYNGEDIVFTCSFGIAELNKNMSVMEDLITLADEALYQAKNKGGNCIVAYDENHSKN